MVIVGLTNCLQMSPSSHSYFLFPTYIKTHLTSFFYLMKPFIKTTPPSCLLFHHKNATEKYQYSNNFGNVDVHVCVLFFLLCVSWSSEMYFGMIYIKTLGSTELHVAFRTLVFVLCCFVYSGTCTSSSFLLFQEPVCLVCRWMGLVFLSL
jgi:hypothetical protein